MQKLTNEQCQEKALLWFERAMNLESSNPKAAQSLLDIATIWELKSTLTLGVRK